MILTYELDLDNLPLSPRAIIQVRMFVCMFAKTIIPDASLHALAQGVINGLMHALRAQLVHK